MSVLTYGGIALQVQKTNHAGVDVVYDETQLDYLWTRITFDVIGLVNLANTAYTTQQGNPAPVASPGTPAFLTVANIIDALSLPRQYLTYVDELNNVMVSSPALAPVNQANFQPGGGVQNNQVAPPQLLDCDCDGGPRPLRAPEILEVHGVKSIIVRFVVSTTVNNSIFWTAQGGLQSGYTPGAGVAATKPPILLSNRWTITETLDEGAWSTRVMAGRAVFRADLLRACKFTPNDGSPARLLTPDDFRSYFAAAYVPPGFQRKQVVVEVEPSGFAARWAVTDVQLPVTLTDQRAYKLEFVSSYGQSRVGFEAALTHAALAAADTGIDLVGGLSFDLIKDFGKGIGALGGLLKTGIRTDLEVLPTSSERHVITAWGQPGSRRLDLAGLCYKAWFNAASPDANDVMMSGTSLTLSVDRMGKWARLEVNLDRGPVNTSVRLGVGGIPDYRSLIAADDGINNVTTSQPGTQPVYPNDNNLRGASYDSNALEALIAQTLMYPYTEAPQPPQAHSQAGTGLKPP